MAHPEHLMNLVESVEDKLGAIGPRNTIAVLLAGGDARLRFADGAHEFRLGGITGTSTMSEEAALESWLRAARRRLAKTDDRIAHKTYRRFPSPHGTEAGMHGGLGRDDFAADDPFNPQGSGPAAITRREG